MSEERDERLSQLRQDLESAALEGNERAREILGYVDAYVESSHSEAAEHIGLREQLEDAVLHFEVSHPRLSTLAARVMDSLSAAGI